jgi:hypothetical protein
VLSLPIYPELEEHHIREVVAAIADFERERSVHDSECPDCAECGTKA